MIPSCTTDAKEAKAHGKHRLIRSQPSFLLCDHLDQSEDRFILQPPPSRTSPINMSFQPGFIDSTSQYIPPPPPPPPPQTDYEVNNLIYPPQSNGQLVQQFPLQSIFEQEIQSLSFKSYEEQLDQIIQERILITTKVNQCENIKKAANNAQDQITPDQMQNLKNDFDELTNLAFNMVKSNIVQSHIWIKNFTKLFPNLEQLLSKLVDGELFTFKENQRSIYYSLNTNENSFDRLKMNFEQMCDVLLLVRKTLYKFNSETTVYKKVLNEDPSIHSINESASEAIKFIDNLIINLVKSSFVIRKQPPQVMKTNVKFSSSVEFLVGKKVLSEENGPPIINAYLISAIEANTFIVNPQAMNLNRKATGKNVAVNEILRNSVSLETTTSVANFSNMQLTKIRRTEKKNAESVTEEKFTILFSAYFNILNGAYKVFVYTMSLPIVVIVHGNQEPHAWATITWDNSFSKSLRSFFAVPESVPWRQLAQILSVKFQLFSNRELTNQDLQFLKGKVLKKENPYSVDEGSLVPWDSFGKEHLPNLNFTFWEWFYAILKLSREHLKHLNTNDGKFVVYFITRKKAEEMLLQCVVGTFLLRYSDSELGGVTIVSINENREGKKEIRHVQPFTARDLSIRGLADRVRDLNDILYFYPNIPKDDIFSKFYTLHQSKGPNGYSMPVLALTFPNFDKAKITQPDLPTAPSTTIQVTSTNPNELSNISSASSSSPTNVVQNGVDYNSTCSPESSQSVTSIVSEYLPHEYNPNSVPETVQVWDCEYNYDPQYITTSYQM